MRTRVIPEFSMPSRLAPVRERSTTRWATKGPRSLTRSTTLLPLRRFVTRILVCRGRILWAQVAAS